MAKRILIVAGNIGVGKTSLAERLGERLGWKTAYESVADNPYLPDFYADMRSWAFHLQVFFLGHRAKQYIDLCSGVQSVVFDRSIYEDAYIFARALHHMNNLAERDFISYRRIFDLVVNRLPTPDLLVYLRAPVKVLLDRIHSRGRAIESGINQEYLSLLESFYDEWMHTFDVCPVLTIRSDDLDFVHKPGHLDIVVKRVQDMLAGKEEVVF